MPVLIRRKMHSLNSRRLDRTTRGRLVLSSPNNWATSSETRSETQQRHLLCRKSTNNLVSSHSLNHVSQQLSIEVLHRDQPIRWSHSKPRRISRRVHLQVDLGSTISNLGSHSSPLPRRAIQSLWRRKIARGTPEPQGPILQYHRKPLRLTVKFPGFKTSKRWSQGNHFRQQIPLRINS